MSNAASKAGWLIFVFALAGAVLHTGPDDPITAGLKSSGVYQPLLVFLSVVLVLLLIWLACVMKKTVAMRRHLDELNGKAGETVFGFKRTIRSRDPLDEVLFYWAQLVPFTLRDLLTNLIIFGGSGSGKTNFGGFHVASAIARHPSCTLLVPASKPDDLQDWRRIFAGANRGDRLMVFGPQNQWRFNPLAYLLSKGADAREITDCLLTIGERLESGDTSGGSGEAQFFAAQNRLWLYNAVVLLKIASGRITATDLLHLISTAAVSPAQLNDPEWREGFHNQILKAAYQKAKNPIDAHDCALATDQWLAHWPTLGERTRGSIQAGLNAILHTANTGIVREMLSGKTNCSPDTMLEEGQSLLIDFPSSGSGPTGRFICGAWKYCTQWAVLRRSPDKRKFFNVIWCDEAQEVVTSFDARYLARCRSFFGSQIYLTQSIHSLYGNIPGESGKSQVDGLLSNFRYKLAHSLGDYQTAEIFSQLLGKNLQTFVGGSSHERDGSGDPWFGQSKYSGNFSEHYEPILHSNAFTSGLRTGRRCGDGYVADAILVRSGEPFPNGENYLKCSFMRKG